MDINRLCMGCMRELARAELAPCPHCGWREGTQPPSVLQLPARTVINNKYLLGRVVGQGGFGITYVGWDIENSRKVAIKEFLPQAVATRAPNSFLVAPSSEKARTDFAYGLERFSEESRILMLFRDHPCIVSFLDFQNANGTAYLVMEYLDGMTLAEYLRRHGERIDCDLALRIMMFVLDGLREVHSRGLLHRDISPDNIFLTSSRAIKLLDFGASRFAMGERSQNLSVILKPGYAPAEQYQQHGRQGPATDMYAAAATFYRAVTGQVPPVALERQVHDSLQLPSRLGIAIPPHVERALAQAMAVQGAQRFSSVEIFQQALRDPAAFPADSEPAKSAPNPILVYAIGAIVSLALLVPFVRWAAALPEAKPTTASAPAPTGGAAPQVTVTDLKVSLEGQRLLADVVFGISPFAGRTGCAVVVFAGPDGNYLQNSQNHAVQLLQEFSPASDGESVRVHFEGQAAQFGLPSGRHNLLSQAVFYANPCATKDDPIIAKSNPAPFVADIP